MSIWGELMVIQRAQILEVDSFSDELLLFKEISFKVPPDIFSLHFEDLNFPVVWEEELSRRPTDVFQYHLWKAKIVLK